MTKLEKKKLYFDICTYEGEVKNDIPHGYGFIFYNDYIQSYEGEFKNGKPHGYGIRVYLSSIYKGEFKNGKYNGLGELKWMFGYRGHYSTHFGEFKNDKREGVGIHRNVNGSTFQGTWKNDEQHGILIYTSASGRVVKLDKVKGRTKNVTTIKKVKEIDKLQNRKIKDNDPEFQKFVKDYLKRNKEK